MTQCCKKCGNASFNVAYLQNHANIVGFLVLCTKCKTRTVFMPSVALEVCEGPELAPVPETRCPECVPLPEAEAAKLHRETMHLPANSLCPRCQTPVELGWQGMECPSCTRQAAETDGDPCMGTGKCLDWACCNGTAACHHCGPL